MKILPYIIPPHLTKDVEGKHTWLGIKLPDNNYLLVLTGRAHSGYYVHNYIKWFVNDAKDQIYVKYQICFIMPSDLFKQYYRRGVLFKNHPEENKDNYIVVHNNDYYHLKDLSVDQWNDIFKYAYEHAQIYDPRVVVKPSKKCKIIAIIFIIIAILAIVLGLGLGLGLK